MFRRDDSEKKKYSRLPEDFTQLLKKSVEENIEVLGKMSPSPSLNIRGRVYPNEVILELELSETDRILRHNFRGSMDYNSEEQDTLDRLDDLANALASMMEQFLEFEINKEDELELMDLPLDYKEFPYDGRKVYLMYHTENTDLDAQADALLGAEFTEEGQKELEDNDLLGVDFFKEAEERYRSENLH